MIKIVLYSENSENTKKIKDLLKSRKDLKIDLGKYRGSRDNSLDPANTDLVLFDITGLFKDDSIIKNGLKQINGLFSSSKTGRILILEPEQKGSLLEDLLFANDFVFLSNMKKELLARIDFLLYKMNLLVPADSLVVGKMALNMEKYELVVDGRIIVLTFKEFEMLKLLMQNRDKVFTRINLLSTVWGYDYYGGSRTVDVHMRRLRAKIPPPYNNMLKTIRNVGYMFSPEG